MFRKVQKWIRSNGKVSINEPETIPKPNKKGQKKSHNHDNPASNGAGIKHKERSHGQTDLVRGEQVSVQAPGDLGDGFRPNDVEAFDIVPISPGISTTKEPRVVLPHGQELKEQNLGNSAEHRASSSAKAVVDTNGAATVLSESEDDSDISVTDLTLLEVNKDGKNLSALSNDMDSHSDSSLSVAEQETLEMFDSVVNDALGLEWNGLDDDEGDEEVVVRSDPPEQKPIDYDNVVGNACFDAPIVRKDENWEMLNLSPTDKKSWRIIPKTEIYLPSATDQNEQASIPELPPADYPITDDETEDDAMNDTDHCSREDGDKMDAETNQIITSFSSIPYEPVSATNEVDKNLPTNHNNNALESHHKTEDTVSISSGSNGSLTTPKSPTGSTRSTDDEKRRSRNSLIYQNVTRASPASPRRPRPRVTSFKSASTPQKLSNKPVNDLVKRYENLKEPVHF